jgi:hypothetical protein
VDECHVVLNEQEKYRPKLREMGRLNRMGDHADGNVTAEHGRGIMETDDVEARGGDDISGEHGTEEYPVCGV